MESKVNRELVEVAGKAVEKPLAQEAAPLFDRPPEVRDIDGFVSFEAETAASGEVAVVAGSAQSRSKMVEDESKNLANYRLAKPRKLEAMQKQSELSRPESASGGLVVDAKDATERFSKSDRTRDADLFKRLGFLHA